MRHYPKKEPRRVAPNTSKMSMVRVDAKTFVFIQPGKKDPADVGRFYRRLSSKKLTDLRKSSQIPRV